MVGVAGSPLILAADGSATSASAVAIAPPNSNVTPSPDTSSVLSSFSSIGRRNIKRALATTTADVTHVDPKRSRAQPVGSGDLRRSRSNHSAKQSSRILRPDLPTGVRFIQVSRTNCCPAEPPACRKIADRAVFCLQLLDFESPGRIRGRH